MAKIIGQLMEKIGELNEEIGDLKDEVGELKGGLEKELERNMDVEVF